MKARDRKLTVLHLLSQESESVSLLDLLKKLGAEYPERSVRRWLNEMTEEGLVERSGQRRATKYRATERSSRRKNGTSNCFGSESLQAIEQVRRPLYERTPVSYEHGWFDRYEPNITFFISSHFRAQLHKAGKRSQNEDPAGTYAHQIFNRLLIDLSYNSSRLEGNTYSLLDTQRLLMEGASAEGKLDEEKVMILNHKEAIRYLVDNAPRLRVNEETIYTLHYLLADGLVETKHAGKVRDIDVRIGGSTYMPLNDPKQLKLQLAQVVEKAALIEDPYEQSLFLLVHVSYLQAFSDVNKRTARLCANISLITNNVVPLSFNDVERDDYNSALIAVYETQDVRPMVDLFVFSYMRTCALYDATVKSMGFDEVRVRYRQQRRSLIRDIILKGLVREAIDGYIASQCVLMIPGEAQKAFLEDVQEDLHEIDPSRIAGMGLTTDQLTSWLARYRSS